MDIVFDDAKDRRNTQERGLPFARAADFAFESALFEIDNRQDYGENRIRALGYMDGKLHALVFTETATGIRVISFRRANKRENDLYEKATQI